MVYGILKFGLWCRGRRERRSHKEGRVRNDKLCDDRPPTLAERAVTSSSAHRARIICRSEITLNRCVIIIVVNTNGSKTILWY
ncbi:unnamed protein product [Acanthoscelides obtectus]|uniref:Uncharacterized protein n=1 Tax=Acanthoscelides obtectus TaxID=200917 RepID=A0A9P0M9R8_ACAOB|nr:unnamed protein product [Acanthoscelides obtectus]CAK1656058.1 hypothetical protein AOBTE_LOCUS19551 [Acanthoscelides obtectus]